MDDNLEFAALLGGAIFGGGLGGVGGLSVSQDLGDSLAGRAGLVPAAVGEGRIVGSGRL